MMRDVNQSLLEQSLCSTLTLHKLIWLTASTQTIHTTLFWVKKCFFPSTSALIYFSKQQTVEAFLKLMTSKNRNSFSWSTFPPGDLFTSHRVIQLTANI